MSKLIVPPPILLASVIAWRNEPVPLSLVFVTLKTNGVRGAPGDSFMTVASGSLTFVIRLACVDSVSLNALAKVEGSNTVAIDTNVRVSTIRRAKACGELFFFIVFFWGEMWERRGFADLAPGSRRKEA